MATIENSQITVQANVKAPIEKVWQIWTDPRHIVKWNQASPDWHTSRAENDLRKGGKFSSRMEARDGSMGFDMEGVYDEVRTGELISYSMADGRKVRIEFRQEGDVTKVTETFDAENSNPVDMQRAGWQAIMDNFKKHVESADNLVSLHYEILINAPVQKVYDTMLIDADKYAEWTSEFAPGSQYKGSWNKGEKILFLAPGEKGELGGMLARIKENVPMKYVSIEHYGMVDNGKEITSGHGVEKWAGALENYTFKEQNGATLLIIDTDSSHEHASYFDSAWPKALQKLKEMCER